MQRKFMEKRGLDPSGSEEGQPDKKRPALARISPKRIEGPDGRDLQLRFRSKLSLPLFTGGKVEGERGAAIHVVLIDANTGHVVTSGPESSVKLDVVVLEGDFNNEDEEGWTQEEFETHMVKEREGKRPLLSGELQVTLKEGVGTLGELTFTDNSSWIRSRKFRLGLKVASGYSEGVHVREAKTDAFTVKDHRGELYKKHYPPALNDEVWRLEKIGKDGSFHKKLNKAGIYSVEDFLRLVVRDPKKLRNVLGSGMSNKMWDVLVEHAKTCILSHKLYVYYSDDVRNVGVVFNHIYELSGLVADGHYYSTDALSDNQKVFVDALMKKAYENWMHVVEYDGKSFLGAHQEKVAAPQIDMGMSQQNYSNSFDHQLSLPPPAPREQPASNQGFTIGGKYPPRNDNNILALGLTQPSTPSFLSGNTNTNTLNLSASFRGLEDFFPEEEIRMRSHEMLENEDMQHLLRLFNMGSGGAHGQTSTSHVNENHYPYSSNYMPNTPSSFGYGFDVDKTRSSGKAVVGWLKLKAALRWGIFIRKQAAERRAQIVELEDP
ncbi:Calmodulin binding protein-like protein [Cynara cardunculus var. scolymus]|uniref:Calmodulin binding protein-like protein n=1 Tax=Cynara cardunculus var. scolymus TaxID=59895 RepID=A0A124SDH2_CYNCS|nr:Calmodulin binding protein-like protein [Cynara cardunculus var. scolymus]